jgi:hypothetical protein
MNRARDIWWTLDYAGAFLSLGVNSRVELIPYYSGLRPEQRSAPLAKGRETHVYMPLFF